MQIPIVSGIYATPETDFRTAYPVNMIPVPKITGVSEGHLRTGDGIKVFASGVGIDRGGIEWRGVLYRVLGSKFVKISATGGITVIGDVGAGGPVVMSYGFDYLAIASAGNLFLYDGSALAQNTDPDLGTVLSVQWIDGYFATTDGEFIVVTELGNPFSVNPIKYGSSEASPDEIKTIVRLNNELYAINRHSIEAFSNTGGQFFPFSVIKGTQIYRGSVGTYSTAIFMGGIAFLGGATNEATGLHLATGGGSVKISTREIDLIFSEYGDDVLADVEIETVNSFNREVLYIHLPDKTVCYDGTGSQALGQPIWYILSSGAGVVSQYRAKNHVWAYGRWIVGDPKNQQIGEIDASIATHWGDTVSWNFTTPIIYNEGKGAVVHDLELSCLAGGATFGKSAAVSCHYSDDGVTWSQRRWVDVGASGARLTPVKWSRLGMFRKRRIIQIEGDSNAVLAASRIDATMEPLAW